MTDNDEKIKQAFANLFTSYGFLAEKHRNFKKRPMFDLSLSDDSNRYLIEIKEKFDSASFLEKRNNCLSSIGDFSSHRIMASLASITYSEQLEKAHKQLSSSSEDAFRIVLYVFHGIHAIADMEAVKATLYGAMMLVSSINASNTRLPCYYFEERSFFTNSNNVDAVILYWPEQDREMWSISLNDYSLKLEQFKQSKLYNIFSKEAITDPKAEEANKKAYSLREVSIKKSHNDTLQKVREKYCDSTLNIMNLGSIEYVIQTKHNF